MYFGSSVGEGRTEPGAPVLVPAGLPACRLSRDARPVKATDMQAKRVNVFRENFMSNEIKYIILQALEMFIRTISLCPPIPRRLMGRVHELSAYGMTMII